MALGGMSAYPLQILGQRQRLGQQVDDFLNALDGLGVGLVYITVKAGVGYHLDVVRAGGRR